MFYIPFVLILPACVYGIGQPHYECGENGRFEYCIDSIPGCIVGCHCHPGYYFDTETKICEPNAKLVQEYRRLYSNSPTRVPEMLLPLNEVDLEPTPTTTNTLDSQVENVAKENDDLGDWLYNQFFKTIESQVINNTDSTDKPPETRRSNREPSNKNKKQKKSKSQSKKGKKKNLRRKLLRITEDDSLFESSSGSSDDSSDESDSSSDSDSSSSSSEIEKKDENDKHEHDDKEHGHRKILVINKKPKPPLPSFIFLPNMGTPFFPPIGLAPPPMPMFPLVPVPPMPMPPIFPPPPPPILVTPPCTDNKAEATTKNETEASTPTTTTTTPQPQPSPPSPPPPPPSPPPGPDKMFYRASGSKHGQRKKLLRELQQIKSMQMRKKSHAEAPEAENFNAPFVAEDSMQFRASPEPFPPPPPAREERPENVDFKYLAQLIHKMDNNKQKPPPPKPNDAPIIPSRRYGAKPPVDYYHPSENSIYTRPNFEHNRHLESPDESYYTNLGHQIASLIRKIDATGEQRVNIEIERQPTPSPAQDLKLQSVEPSPFIMENSYAPRSYWERTVRSLLKHLQPEDQFYRRKINEDSSLFNLERKVETIATTTRSLSLNDLENVVFLIDKAKSKMKNSGVSTEAPAATTTVNDNSLNINLLPPHPFEHTELERKIYEYELRRAMPQQKRINNLQDTQVAKKPDNYSEVLKRLIDNNQQNNLRGALLHNFQPVSRVEFENNYNAKKNLHKNKNDLKNLPEFSLENLANLSNQLLKVPSHNPNRKFYRNITLNQHDIANIQARLNQENIKRNKLPNVPWLGQKLASLLSHPEIYHRHHQPIKMKLLPLRHNYQSNKLYVDSNRYLHHKEAVSMPQRAPARPHGAPAPAQYSRGSEPSSYFHHEIQHFDMFENK